MSELEHPDAECGFVVLDANRAGGGAWQHRWESLRMATVNGIFDLPGFPLPPVDPLQPSREAVPRYFAGFEDRYRESARRRGGRPTGPSPPPSRRSRGGSAPSGR